MKYWLNLAVGVFVFVICCLMNIKNRDANYAAASLLSLLENI